MARFLGIDLGTSFLKGAVLDLDRPGVSHVRRVSTPEPVEGLPPTRHELAPAQLLDAVRGLLNELLAAAPDAAGLVTCGQMHGLVLCDDRGNPRTNVITWKDQRAVDPPPSGRGTVFEELARLVTDEERHETGNELRVGVPVTTLYWLRQHGDGAGHLYPVSLPDFVLADLCDAEPTTELTSGAAYGLFDLARGDWHRGLIEKLGLGSLRWPRVRPFGESVGVARLADRRLTCYTPVGDQQCALVGVGMRERELSLNISTGSQVSLVGRDLPRGDVQVRPYFDGTWLRTVVQVPAGRSLDLLVGLLTEIAGGVEDAWRYIQGVVEHTPETDLEVDLGFFGCRAGGRIANIREGNLTIGHLFAAAFRGMADNYARCAAALSPHRAWDRVVFSGGLTRRFPRLRREVLARLGDPPHRTAPAQDDTLHGLLALALACAGRAPTVADAIALATQPR